MELSRFITRVPSASRFRTEFTQDTGTGVFVDLMIDRNFKMVFTKESNKDVLIDMLNCFLQDVDIRSLEFLPQGQNPGRKDLVASVFDVSCITADGRRIVVEVQYNERKDYLDRVLYYATWPIAEQIAVGTGNYRLNEVYVVSFLNFALEHDSTWDGGVVSSYSIREDCNGEKMTDALHFVFIELGRFAKSLESGLDLKEWWMYSLKNMGRMRGFPEGNIPEVVRRLYDVTAVESLDNEDKTRYLHNMRNELDIRTEKIMAREEGREEGLAEGMEKGMEKGIKKGMMEGKVRKAIEIARKLLASGMTSDQVFEITGMTSEQINGHTSLDCYNNSDLSD